MIYPVADDFVAQRSQYRFGVELDAVYVQCAVAQSHNQALVADGGDGQCVGKPVAVHHPRVVAAYGDARGQSVEQIIVGQFGMLGRGQADFGLYAVEHVGQVAQLCAEGLTDGLFTQADT